MPTCLFVRIAVKYVFVKACSIRLCYGKNPFILGVHSTQNGRMANVLVSDIMYRKSHALDQPTPSPPLVHSKLDYCNSLYFNLPKTQINRLQHIQNSLARTVANTPKYSHITPVLKSLHWLKIEQRIQYKLISLTYKVLTTSQLTYLHNLISLQTDNNTRSSDVVTLACPSPASSLKVTDRSFQYDSSSLESTSIFTSWTSFTSLCLP